MDFEPLSAREEARAQHGAGLFQPERSSGEAAGGGESEQAQDPLYCAIALRSDLPPEHQIIQAAHAAFEAGAMFGLPEGAPLHLALLEAKSERELMNLAREAEADGVQIALFFEPDGDTGATAFATEPMRKGQSRALRRARKWPGRRLGT